MMSNAEWSAGLATIAAEGRPIAEMTSSVWPWPPVPEH
jgi:hypothetical protein